MACAGITLCPPPAPVLRPSPAPAEPPFFVLDGESDGSVAAGASQNRINKIEVMWDSFHFSEMTGSRRLMLAERTKGKGEEHLCAEPGPFNANAEGGEAATADGKGPSPPLGCEGPIKGA
mmetsp:Transcript_128524/g.256739  ORF Transcript_128524/g.256739 Transcript_128524/m.256739 type:complete len:120 (-) Transcript_128524:21-380(-)|eukprot:CAMPEP_0172723988 /NCGR_PEP_ID=MMETSP1074-20121228/84924_1 /TAXON_ID=2916 /ORGANISM="Ceratium fusus, Strain PA161109" /LENGTH=119 /DNA_ID=CAMNT_0013550335 /DNA_START=75 /DNA_END=434 /DNA_ORIENTATION=-